MSRILLVAMREFRQIAGARSFWITLLILPAALAIGPIASSAFEDSHTKRVMLIDPDGREAAALRAQIGLDNMREQLVALSHYAERHDLDRADLGAVWARHDRPFGDADIAAFEQSGGLSRALARMKPALADGMPDFTPPAPPYEIVATPAAIAHAPAEKLDELIEPLLHPGKSGKGGTVGGDALDYAVFVPHGFGPPDAPARLWARDDHGGDFVATVQSVLTRDLRGAYLASAGLNDAQIRAAGMLTPAIRLVAAPPETAQSRILVRSAAPLLCAYLLLMSLLLSGSWMLQGMVEERSNKLVETVLACVSPNELMYGKLAGTVAVGLAMVAVWVACVLGAAFVTHGAVADFLKPALSSVSSPGIIAAIVFFFLAGYLMIAMVFLAIGATSDSFREAQGYLTPVILAIMLPFVLLAKAVLAGNAGIGVTILTWIPVYTPFAILARLGTGLAWWEIVGTGAVLAVFVGIEMVLLGRVFRASLLNSGQKPSLAALGRMMLRGPV